ncbi:terpene synthase family protein [Streptomyces enissocaesilis]|uniref:Terpene synthase n=1 Tax=Streptomyces enissocaesilis TaxID=332589 RepID=A0ABN3XN77_9ACTN
MSQHTEFTIPFASTAPGADVDRARQVNIQWAVRHALLGSPEAVTRYTGWRLPELAARFHPHATGDDLVLAADLQCFFFLFDDQFDAPEGLRPQAVKASMQLLDLLHQLPGTRPAYATPATLAWADVWERSCEGMSPAWKARATHEWARYFVGNLMEDLKRRNHPIRTLEEYVVFRRQTIATGPVYDMSERVQHFEIPVGAFHTPQIQGMRDLATDVVTLCNDVASVSKEETRSETLNSVLLLESTADTTREDAIRQIEKLVSDKVRAFLTLQEELDDALAQMHVGETQCRDTHRYVRDALHSMMRGNYDWQRSTDRYSATSQRDLRPADVPNYYDDLVSPMER